METKHNVNASRDVVIGVIAYALILAVAGFYLFVTETREFMENITDSSRGNVVVTIGIVWVLWVLSREGFLGTAKKLEPLIIAGLFFIGINYWIGN